jgi:aryl-alcohol dehydrogenase-like predicted oxidoreductase
MRKISLGKTGIEISVMGLGTMYFGSKVDEGTSFRLMDLYMEHGGNFLDSANKYASWLPGYKGGESEVLIGKWLNQRGRAGDLLISSKVGFPYGDVPRSLKKEIIISECELSLRRLGVECIDLYFAHAYDSDTPVEETMEAFYQLKKAGKIRFIGASNYMAWRLEEANSLAVLKDWEGFSCLQQRHTYLESNTRADFGNQLILTPEIVDQCKEREISLMAYSPLLGGIYGKEVAKIPPQYQSLDSRQKLDSLLALASNTGHSPNQLVLSWMLHSSPSVIPLVTGSNEKQLMENLEAASVSLSSEDMEILNGPVQSDPDYK